MESPEWGIYMTDWTNESIEEGDWLDRARPLLHQRSHEIQPFGQLVKLPIALDEDVCRQSIENLNQLLSDTMVLRDR